MDYGIHDDDEDDIVTKWIIGVAVISFLIMVATFPFVVQHEPFVKQEQPPDQIRKLQEEYVKAWQDLDVNCRAMGGFTHDFGDKHRPNWKCVKELTP